MSRLISFMLIILSSLGMAFASSTPLQEEVRTDFVFQIIASQCDYQPDKVRFLTGFRVKEKSGVITALHGVVDCNTIQVRSNKKNVGSDSVPGYQVSEVDIVHDIAFLTLKTDDQLLNNDGYESSGHYSANEKIIVVGHPRGTSAVLTSRNLMIRDTPTETLSELIADDSIYNELDKRKSPELNIDVISIEAQLEPGHSGSPILNLQNQIIGVVNGGLNRGASQVVWGIPWEAINLTPMDSVQDKLESLKTSSPVLFFSEKDTNSDNAEIEIQVAPLSKPFTVTISSQETTEQSRFLGFFPEENLASAKISITEPNNNTNVGNIEEWIQSNNRWFRVIYLKPILLFETRATNSERANQLKITVVECNNAPVRQEDITFGITKDTAQQGLATSLATDNDGIVYFPIADDPGELSGFIKIESNKYQSYLKNFGSLIEALDYQIPLIPINGCPEQQNPTVTSTATPNATVTFTVTPVPTSTPTFVIPPICVAPNRIVKERLAVYCRITFEELKHLNPSLPNSIEIDTVVVIPTSTPTNVPQ